ncbi:hypothetical protein GCM10009808_15620 [Microbacterium sediminicola]|uniref:Helicase/secretion neighborhood TadE-like protein n=1 Tax=Microbacterium sediminicola TaxID=415210 RepID=A0ABP4U8A6_9MICO
MPGTVATVGSVSVCAVLALAGVHLGAAALVSQRAAGAADAAALAAADVASGALVGVPCERAAEVAGAVDARLLDCDLTGLVATVSVALTWGGFDVWAFARAGPPPVSS